MESSSPIKPNLFIVGFAKCGTTALHEYLSTHPNVHPSFPKEPHFAKPTMNRFGLVGDKDSIEALTPKDV